MNNPMINHIENLLKELEIEDYSVEENEISISSSYPSGLKLHIQTRKSNLDFYYSVRTSSWTYPGERSDLHDVISIAFSAFLKFSDSKISCSLISVINPAVPELDNEIYARYIVPIQYDFSKFSNKNDLKLFCERLVLGMFLFENLFWRLAFHLDENLQTEELNYSFELSDSFNETMKIFFDEESYLNTAVRDYPSWEYIGDSKNGLTVVESKELAFYLSTFIESFDNESLITGINGNLLLTKEYKNFLLKKDIDKITSIFKKFGDNPEFIFPLENKIIGVGEELSVFIDSFCDFQSFKIEKEKIKQRHLNESKLLFPPEKVIWADKIDDDKFELLIKALLERQEDIVWTRRIGHVNEPDGGRDLIAEWLIKPSGKESRKTGEQPNKIKRIIVQCKGYKNGVGKSDVTDIRDTIEHNDCDGYFLAVSSHLKRSLTEHLEKMKYSGKYWIDWWTKDEIEFKLIENIDIAKKFSDIITIKN